MAENKTKRNALSLDTFLDAVDPSRKDEVTRLIELFTQATTEAPVMWGPSIVGFGTYHYRYESGREGDWMKLGFSPRKAALTLYFWCSLEALSAELAALGSHKLGKGCVYIASLNDVNSDALVRLLAKAYKTKSAYSV